MTRVSDYVMTLIDHLVQMPVFLDEEARSWGQLGFGVQGQAQGHAVSFQQRRRYNAAFHSAIKAKPVSSNAQSDRPRPISGSPTGLWINSICYPGSLSPSAMWSQPSSLPLLPDAPH